ncbi:MAG: hypothetical protein MZU97_21605 [Bacillus subtilis]|nr:hypothetical protein [Bacillus subtilis]
MISISLKNESLRPRDEHKQSIVTIVCIQRRRKSDEQLENSRRNRKKNRRL